MSALDLNRSNNMPLEEVFLLFKWHKKSYHCYNGAIHGILLEIRCFYGKNTFDNFAYQVGVHQIFANGDTNITNTAWIM